MSVSVEAVRRRMKAMHIDVSSMEYGEWMHEAGFYEDTNSWEDDEGVLHLYAPAKPSAKGLRAGAPFTEIIVGIPRVRAPDNHAET